MEWIPSRIIAVNGDGTYRVVYDGRHVAGSVPQASIRSTEAPPPAPAPPPSADDIPEPPGYTETPNQYQQQQQQQQQQYQERGVGKGAEGGADDEDPTALFPGHKVVDVISPSLSHTHTHHTHAHTHHTHAHTHKHILPA